MCLVRCSTSRDVASDPMRSCTVRGTKNLPGDLCQRLPHQLALRRYLFRLWADRGPLQEDGGGAPRTSLPPRRSRADATGRRDRRTSHFRPLRAPHASAGGLQGHCRARRGSPGSRAAQPRGRNHPWSLPRFSPPTRGPVPLVPGPVAARSVQCCSVTFGVFCFLSSPRRPGFPHGKRARVSTGSATRVPRGRACASAPRPAGCSLPRAATDGVVSPHEIARLFPPVNGTERLTIWSAVDVHGRSSSSRSDRHSMNGSPSGEASDRPAGPPARDPARHLPSHRRPRLRPHRHRLTTDTARRNTHQSLSRTSS